MRRTVLATVAALLLSTEAGLAQGSNLPPHAWLFGTWIGGLFPPIAGVSPQSCFAQPVVIFTHDLVMRATLTEQTLTQRVIESARAAPDGLELRFAATGAGPLLGGTDAPGFGCESADVLHVQRRAENQIVFPGCAEFPYPLVRCQTR